MHVKIAPVFFQKVEFYNIFGLRSDFLEIKNDLTAGDITVFIIITKNLKLYEFVPIVAFNQAF